MPHPTWRPHGTRPRASGSAYRRAPEVADGPAPCSGLCGAADAPALSIPGQPGGRPWSSGSGGSGSARPRHGQLWRGTAGASLRSPPCPAALAPARSSPPRLRFPCVLSVSFPVPLHPARPDLGWLCASQPGPQPRPRAVLHTPTLTSAWLGPSCPDPGLGLAGPSHPVPGLTRCLIRDPSRLLGPHTVSEGVSSLNLRFYVPFPVPHPDGQTSPRSLLSQSFQLLCASPAFPPCPGPWLSPWSSETFLLPARFPSHSLSLNVQFQPSPLFSVPACCVTCGGRGVVEEKPFHLGAL